MKRKYWVTVYDSVLYISCFFATLALYCKSSLHILKIDLNELADNEVVTLFCVGVIVAFFITLLLRYQMVQFFRKQQ